MTAKEIAVVCHEANRSYCRTIGDATQKPWIEAEQWQQDSAIKGVEFALANPACEASSQHNAWLRDKEADGWKFGPVKDAIKKEHPCFVPYHQLPKEQQAKDALFLGVVRALAPLLTR